jgi:two-component system, NarL family, invasion response regulator UvrY
MPGCGNTAGDLLAQVLNVRYAATLQLQPACPPPPTVPGEGDSESTMSIKVLFIDDEPRLRQAWERLFASQVELKLVGMLARSEGLREEVEARTPDVVVMDLSLPGADPFKSIADLSGSCPDAKVVVYSARSDLPSKKAAFDSGAWAFVDKLTEPKEIFDVIRRVAAGELVLPPDMARDP